MAPEIGGADGDHHEMPEAGFDVLITPGAQVGLRRLKRLDHADLGLMPALGVYRGIRTHSMRATTTTNAAISIT